MKVLIIRFSSIGDIILCTPIIRCVKNQYASELHFLTSSKFSNVLENNPHIDKIHLYNDNFKELKSHLLEEKFDLIIDLHKSRLSWKFTSSLDVKKITFNKLNVKKWIYVNFKVNLLPSLSIVDRYFEELKSFNVQNDGLGLDYHYVKESVEHPIEKYDVLILGAAHFTKRIPLELAKRIIDKSDSILLLGGKDVEAEGLELASYNKKVINRVGQTNFNQAANYIDNASMVFTSDTGLMHMAAALKKEITIYWGNTTPDFGMFPYYGEKNKINYISKEVVNLSCRPCSKIGFEKCPKGHFKCMMDQEV